MLAPARRDLFRLGLHGHWTDSASKLGNSEFLGEMGGLAQFQSDVYPVVQSAVLGRSEFHGTWSRMPPGTSTPASSEALIDWQKNCGLVFSFLSTHRGVPVFLSVQDKLSELLLLALGACLTHKLLAHLKREIVVNIKNRGISYRNPDFWFLLGKKRESSGDTRRSDVCIRTGW